MKYIPSFYYFHAALYQLFNSTTTTTLSRFGDKSLSTLVFEDDFQRIEGPATKAKEVSHGAMEQVLVV